MHPMGTVTVSCHNSAGQHHGERHTLIARLQNLAKAKSVRVSFVGGDVHVAGVGRLYTQSKVHRLRHDHRVMPQVCCLFIIAIIHILYYALSCPTWPCLCCCVS